jgi:hypothetical protein
MLSGLFRLITYILSAEWMLKHFRTNGGDVIIARALLITVWVLFAAIYLRAWIDPELAVHALHENSYLKLRKEALAFAPWASAVFGGAYLALYARFSSQWGYLANLYNQIKQVEASEVKQPDALATWKAGFIEDAENLHLACKDSIAPILHAWASDGSVSTAFVNYAPGGKRRLDKLKAKVQVAYRKAETRNR